ncbi:MAG: hypothetical protein K8S98_18410 [Planctomycetes bacterium]|nr:hypothetical protein [Planctomycetota bacterium]
MEFRAILIALERGRVDYVVVGGVAAVLQGVPVNTFDLDVVHSRDPGNLTRLAAVLRALEACYREHLPKRIEPLERDLALPGHHLPMTRLGPLDVLGTIFGAKGYAQLVDHAPRVDLNDGLVVRLLELADLVAIKRLLNRDKDRAQLHEYERELELRNAMETRDGR